MCCINQDNKSPPYGEHCSCYSIDESKKSQNLMNRLNNNKWEEEELEGKKKPKKKCSNLSNYVHERPIWAIKLDAAERNNRRFYFINDFFFFY